MKDLWLYSTVARLGALSYRGKIMLVAFVGTHIPLISVAIYIALHASAQWQVLAVSLGVTLVATLAGTAVTLFALHHLLRPVMLTARALREYRASRARSPLPEGYTDEAGQLMADAKRTIDQLDGTVRMLEHINQDLESFSYAVAHDLRGPLRRMTGFAQLLADDVEAAQYGEVRTYTDYISENARKMSDLVDGLLALAQSSHGELAHGRVRMDALLEDVLGEQQARLRTRVEVTALPAVKGDAATLRQVWANLISNALKYSGRREGPVIEVGWRAESGAAESGGAGGDAVFFVRDNGAGFDPALARKLFDPFQRAPNAQDFEGTGVGLATVRRIVQRYGGRIWAESRLGAGATFYFALPLAVVEGGAGA